jgi:hypothetical protein
LRNGALLCLNFGDSIHPMPGNRLWVCSTEAWAAVGGQPTPE